MKRKTLERDIEKALVAKLKSLGGIAYKFCSPQNRGVPDRICLLPEGRLVFVECKRPGGKPTNNQLRVHEKIKALGHDVRIVDSIDKVNLFPEDS